MVILNFFNAFHIVCSYCYKKICVDEVYSKPYKTYFGKDAIDKFLNDMILWCHLKICQ